jgi:replicative DNA helicase
MRMLSQTGEIDATRLRKRDLTEYHWHKIDAAVEQLAELPIFITHDSIDIDEIRRLVGVLADEAPLGLVIVDYLQLIDAPAGIQERRLQVEAVSKRLKGITLDFGVPVLCLSSLSRPPDGKAPTLASLRESGNLEHDADTVILLHQPAKELEPRRRSASSRRRATVAQSERERRWWSCVSARRAHRRLPRRVPASTSKSTVTWRTSGGPSRAIRRQSRTTPTGRSTRLTCTLGTPGL